MKAREAARQQFRGRATLLQSSLPRHALPANARPIVYPMVKE